MNFYYLIGGKLANYEFIKFVNFVNLVLFKADLMSTGCVENDNTDEYLTEAEEIAKMVACGFSLIYSVKTVFEAYFWDDCLSDEALNTICTSLSLSSN